MKRDTHLYGQDKEEFLSDLQYDNLLELKSLLIDKLTENRALVLKKRPLDVQLHIKDIDKAIQFWENV